MLYALGSVQSVIRGEKNSKNNHRPSATEYAYSVITETNLKAQGEKHTVHRMKKNAVFTTDARYLIETSQQQRLRDSILTAAEQRAHF